MTFMGGMPRGDRSRLSELGIQAPTETGEASEFAAMRATKTEDRPSGLGAHARREAARYSRDAISPAIVSGTVRGCELGLLVLAGFAAHRLFFEWRSVLTWQVCVTILAVALSAMLVFELSGAYRMSALKRPLIVFPPLALKWTVILSAVWLVRYLLDVDGGSAPKAFVAWGVAGGLAIFCLRWLAARPIRRWTRDGRIERRVIVVGGGEVATQLIRAIEQQPFNDVRICGIFDDRKDHRSPSIVAGYPKIGDVAELGEFARIARIDMLIIALPVTAEQRVLQLLRKLWVLPVDIRLPARSSELRLRPRSYSYIGTIPFLDVFDRPINDWDRVAKRMFDIAFALLGIVLSSPVMLVTALAIKLDSKGPILFKQKRHGFNNEVIEVYKFRSMYTEKSDATGRNTVSKNDPRVTRVGRFIRKTSIDELPQFFNALFGSLSLVGPRPHAVAAQSRDLLYDEVVEGYFARHKVKPGVTGWAQINGWRGEMDNADKIRIRTEHDLFYIENWSILFDLKILLLTPIRLLNTENAY